MNLLTVITGSGLPVWVEVVEVLGGTSCKCDASPLFLTRWQHFTRQWYQVCVVCGHMLTGYIRGGQTVALSHKSATETSNCATEGFENMGIL